MVLIKNALANIKASKLRVFAAMIWIVLGITSVVIVASVGNGLEAKIGEASEDAQKRVITLEFYPTLSEMSTFLQPFSHQTIESISFMEGVEKVDTSGETKNDGSLSTQLFYEGRESNSTIKGYKKDDNVKIQYGREFGYEDEERSVMILGYDTAVSLFDNPEDAIEKVIEVDGKYFEIVGVAAEDTSKKTDSYMFDNSYVPTNALNNILTSFKSESTVGLTAISVTILPGYDLMETGWTITDKLNENNVDGNGFYSAKNNDEELRELQMLQSYISEFTAMLTAASLFIGGIGIMNIMYMSVVERKREIGIRRAIGAKPKNILTQFLIESVVITSLGGVIGIISGIIVSIVISNLLPFKIVPTLSSYLYAVGASMLIGIVFGIIPAFKASRMDPIKAIQGQN